MPFMARWNLGRWGRRVVKEGVRVAAIEARRETASPATCVQLPCAGPC
jgi:hypothetical protein